MPRSALALLLFVATACTGGGSSPSSPAPTSIPRGGTLRVAMIGPAYQDLDPQNEYDGVTWEVLRCCLARTLLSYNGTPTEKGGAEVRPDLAASMPTVSDDGLTWTFRIKPGIHYGPPLQDVEVTSGDFVRALERMLTVVPKDNDGENSPRVGTFGDYDFYYTGVIEGAQEFADGSSDSISGLATPDAHTLEIHLLRPDGDLAYRMAMPGTAPIPPNPSDPQGRLGIATGHPQDYGRYLVSTGPYMFEGSERLDFSKPADEQRPVAGYIPAESVTLVRNPSWDPTMDDLRPAYADRIQIAVRQFDGSRADVGRLSRDVRTGSTDVVLFPFPAISERLYRRLAPSRHAFVEPTDFVSYISMNVAEPPFDDVHVRRALNYAIDRPALLPSGKDVPPSAPPITDLPATHIALDSQEDDLLARYDPYGTRDGPDLTSAKREMAKSPYDRDHDGECDVDVCRDVRAVASCAWSIDATADRVLAAALEPIGISLDVDHPDCPASLPILGNPREHVAIGLGLVWGKDYPNATDFFEPLFASSSTFVGTPYRFNVSILGATSEELRSWGYSVRSVPSADAAIDRCNNLIGTAQVECWAKLDQYLMEQVVPWVPMTRFTAAVAVSPRVASFSFDQFTVLPALDRIALTPGSS